MLNIKLPIQIATDVANISTHTLLLEISESNIFEKLEKLGIDSDVKLTHLALRHGLIQSN